MRNVIILLTLFLLGGIMSSCHDSSDNDSSNGKIKLLLTDAPFPGDLVKTTNVVINKIEIRKANSSDNNPFITLSSDTKTINLLDLTNGVTKTLIDTEIPVGTYDLIRLHVVSSDVTLTDNRKFDLKIPSGSQTGIKVFVKPSIEVAGGLTTELLLDFDVSKSFVVQGNPSTVAGIKGFHFKPVVRASNLSTSGRLQGTVANSKSEGINGAVISIIAADTVYTSAVANSSGAYKVLGIAAGTYKVKAEHNGYQEKIIENVKITAANATTQNITLTK